MRALLQAMNDSEHLLVGEAEISRASGSIGVLGEWKSGRQGIVLKPDTYDGEAIFKTPFGRVKRPTSRWAAASSCRRPRHHDADAVRPGCPRGGSGDAGARGAHDAGDARPRVGGCVAGCVDLDRDLGAHRVDDHGE
jgi:hypothetical protein